MARMRSLRPDYFLREDMADVSLEAHFLLAGLAVLADRDGRLLDRPRTIKAQVFPFREVDLDAALTELVRARAVARYEADGKRVLALLTWEDDQTPHPKETSLGLPPPPAVQQDAKVVPPSRPSGKPPEPSRKVGEPSRRDPLGLGVGMGVGPEMGVGQKPAPVADAPVADVMAAPTPRKPRKEASGPAAELWRALEAKFLTVTGQPYVTGNGTVDGATVSWFLNSSKATPAEVVARWGRLLEWAKGGYPTVSGFVVLRSNWNAPQVLGIVTSKPRGNGGYIDPNKFTGEGVVEDAF